MKLRKLLTGILCIVLSASLTAPSVFVSAYDGSAVYGSVSDEEYLAEAVSALGSYKLSPVFGTDTNVCDMLEAKLDEAGFSGIDVSIKSVDTTYTGGGIEDDGTITYFYDNPDVWRAFWGVTSRVVFTLNYNGAETETSPSGNIVIGWDEDKVSDYMHENVIDNITFPYIGGTNTDENNVVSDLTLPQYYGDNRNVRISWKSDNESAILPKAPSGSIDDVVYGNYTGTVNQGKDSAHVTLTATFDFAKGDNISETKDFYLTVPGTDVSAVQSDMQKILDAFTTDKIKNLSDGESIGSGDAVTSDLKLPAPSELGIYDREYDVILSVDKPEDIEYINVPDVNNAARAYVFRPLPEEGDKTVSFTVTLKSTVYPDTSASKTFTVTLKALDSEELQTAVSDMEYVKNNFFEFIKGANSDKDNVTENLHSFYGIYKENGEFSAKSYTDKPNVSGIISVCINPNAEVDYRTYFQSGNTDVITNENLLVTRPLEDTSVTVTACLTDEKYSVYLDSSAYPLKYEYDYSGKYQNNEFLASLSRQLVTADVTVKADVRADVKIGIINGSENPAVQMPVTVTDRDSDNKLTVNDALLAFHDISCPDGYKTDADGKITKLWNTESDNIKIYKNNSEITAVNTEALNSGDIINAVINGGNYAYFNLNETYHLIGGDSIKLTLLDTSENPVVGAVIGEINSSGEFVPFEGITTGEDGSAEFSLDTPGIKYITAQNADNTLTVPVCIVNAVEELTPIQYIILSKASAAMRVGTTLKLNAEIYPAEATDKIAVWESSNPEIAVVNSDGTVTALKTGKVMITASCDSPPYWSASCMINVTDDSSSGSSGGGGSEERTFSVSFKLTAAGNSVWIKETKVAGMTEKNTVFDVFQKVLADNGFTYGGNGTYVSSVTNSSGRTLSEFDYGNYSGWMYSVDGEIPFVSMDQYYLIGDDEILFFYISDYTTTMSGMTTTVSVPSDNSKLSPSPSPSPVPDDGFRFDDVNDDDWYYDAVYDVYKRNLFKGISDKQFSPLGNMTRAMFVTVLHRLAGTPEVSGTYFNDIEDKAWYSEAVAWAAENNIVKGVSSTEFAPEQNITREQMAVMLYNYAKPEQTAIPDADSYSDFSSVSAWAKDAVSWAVSEEIINGREDMTLDPLSPVTRAEAAAMLMRFAAYFE